MSIRQPALILLALIMASAEVHRLRAQTRVELTGVVTDLATKQPIPAVSVIVNDGVVAITNPDGTFKVANTLVLPGPNVVMFRRIGYEPAAKIYEVAEGQTEVALEVTLEALPIDLEEVVVEEEPASRGKLSGFYERRLSGLGQFLGPAEIERARRHTVADILATLPGVIVSYGRIRFARTLAWCRNRIGLYLDGYWFGLHDQDFDAVVNHQDIAAIEVYRGPARVPEQYRRLDTNCGVILIWTK